MTALLKFHGGKTYVAGAVLKIMPRHLSYVEPFAGGLQVLFARDPADRRLWWAEHPGRLTGVSEVVNDKDSHLANLYEVVRSDRFGDFHRMAELTLFSEAEYRRAERVVANKGDGDAVRWAWGYFVLVRQSYAGTKKGFAAVSKSRTRGRKNEQVNAWLGAVDDLPAIHERLRDVLVLNRDALEVIADYDRPDALIYCDPPYPAGTRTAPDMYDHEMTDEGHKQLLDVITRVKSRVIVSSNPNAMYDDALTGWSRHAIDLANHSAGGRAKQRRQEVLWWNYPHAPPP